MQQAIFFSDAGLNRAAEMRVDKTKLSEAFDSPEALVRASYLDLCDRFFSNR